MFHREPRSTRIKYGPLRSHAMDSGKIIQISLKTILGNYNGFKMAKERSIVQPPRKWNPIYMSSSSKKTKHNDVS